MKRALASILRLGVKELRSLRADPVLVVLIIYTFTYAIYAVATGVRFEVRNASIAVVDEDRSEVSRRIVDALLPPYFQSPVEISSDQIDPAMDRGAFVFVIEIPPRFEMDLLSGRQATVQINVDATAMAQAGNGSFYIGSIIRQEVRLFLDRDEARATSSFDLVIRSMFNPNLEATWFTAVMQIINNISMLSVILAGAALIREREHGTIEHLLVMPVRPSEIMLAKIWANGVVIVAAATASLALVVHGLLNVPISGSIALFVAGTVLYQVAVTAIGILLAIATGSMPQFGLAVLPVLITMNLLSGSTTPLESMPIGLQAVMWLSPSTHFVGFAQAVLYRGAGFDIVWPSLTAILAISAVCFAAALMWFRRMMTPVG